MMRRGHFGKFEGEPLIAKLLYNMQEVDDEMGEFQDFGYFWKVKAPFFSSSTEARKAAVDAGIEPLTDEELRFLLNQRGGAILQEDSQGSVWVDWFDTKRDLDARWRKIEREYEKFSEGRED